MELSLLDIPFEPERPPAAAIPDALRQTELALVTMKASDRFEDLVVLCLQDLDPTLRPTGGSGDRQRDAVAGALFLAGETVLTISLERTWSSKIRRDLAGLASNPPAPKRVIAVTNRRTSPRTRKKLEDDALSDYGTVLQVLDQRFLALRLLRHELLAIREELLGLPPPAMPVALEAEAFSANLPGTRSRVDALYGRDADLSALLDTLKAPGTTALEGAGGIGKTRLAVEAAKRVKARALFIDDRSALSRRELPIELSGFDHLVLVVDNAHRRKDLRELVGLLHQRSGPTNLLLIARPGFRGHLLDAVEGSVLGPLAMDAILELNPLAPAAIGDIVRNAKPELKYRGSIDRAIEIAEGNPLLALFAHGVAVEGGALDQLGQAGVLGEHARSLIASLIERVDEATEHEVSELLAVIAALTYVDLDETAVVGAVVDLLGMKEIRLRRLLHDFADAGIVAQRQQRFAVTPDILSGHILWSSLFAENPRVALRYDDLWAALAPLSIDRLCTALGGLPSQSVGNDHPAGRFIAAELLHRAEAGEQVLALTRAVAPALPWLAAEIVDVALTHLPAEPRARARALVAAAEALARTPSFDQGWPRQLAVAAAAFASAGSDETEEAARKRVSDDLTTVYSRVPIDVGPDEGRILAVVQHEMADTTKSFWRRHRNEPGAAEAVGIAARQLLSVTFDSHYASVEDDRLFHLRGMALPASRWTREALFAGSRLFAETLPRLPLKIQIEQAHKLNNLAQAAGGFHDRFGAHPSDDMAELAREAQTDLVARLRHLSDLPVVVRAALEDELHTVWPDDQELREFHDLLSVTGGRRGREAWDNTAASQRVEDLARRVVEARDATAILARWAAWLGQAQESGYGGWSTHIVASALRAAAIIDPVQMADLLDHLLQEGGPLTAHVVDALAVTFRKADASDQRARRLVASEVEEVRATAARAVGASPLALRLELLTHLIGDPSFRVRSATQAALIYDGALTQTELDLALRACLPRDLDGLTHVLWQVAHKVPPTTAVVGTDQLAMIRNLVLNVAGEDRLDGHALKTVFEFTGALDPRLPIDFARTRIEQQLADDRPRDLSAIMRVDALPRDVRSVVRAAATEDDLIWILDRIEDSDPGNLAHGALRDLLEWLDDGPIVTARVGVWFASGDDRLNYEARRVLNHRLAPDAYRNRARALLTGDVLAELEDAIIEARQPQAWSGTRHRFWRSHRDEFATWVDDEDEALGDVGRAGVAYYQRLLDDEADADPGDDLTENDAEEDA